MHAAQVGQHLDLLAGGAGGADGFGLLVAQAGQLGLGRAQVGDAGLRVAQQRRQARVLRLQVGRAPRLLLAPALQFGQPIGQRLDGRLGALQGLVLLRRGALFGQPVARGGVDVGVVGHGRQPLVDRSQPGLGVGSVALFRQVAAGGQQRRAARLCPLLRRLVQLLAARFQPADVGHEQLLGAGLLAQILRDRAQARFLGPQSGHVGRRQQSLQFRQPVAPAAARPTAQALVDMG